MHSRNSCYAILLRSCNSYWFTYSNAFVLSAVTLFITSKMHSEISMRNHYISHLFCFSLGRISVIFYREDVWDNHTQYVLKIHVLSLQMSLTVSIIVSSEELNKCSCTLIFNALNLAKSHLKWKCFPNVVVLWNHLLIWSVKSVFFSLSLWVANIVLKELYYNNIEKASNNSN